MILDQKAKFTFEYCNSKSPPSVTVAHFHFKIIIVPYKVAIIKNI